MRKRPGQPDFLRGYGLRTLGQATPIGADTLFAVASNSKAMTAAGLAVLVDQGKLGWDDLVTKHLPEFAMFDPETTRLMTVRDLLTHRSGLPLGAGDLMIWPGCSTWAKASSMISMSRSVAEKVRRSPSAESSTLERIGIVFRRSTALCTCPSAFRSAARSIVNFMVSPNL